jgi:hypothetical protein
MGAIEEYKARNAARDARCAEKQKPPEKRRWWFNQPIPIDRFTGWLVAWTALLFGATVFNVVVINHTDEKIGGQLEEMKKAYGPLKDSADAAKAAIIAGQRAWIRIDSITADGLSVSREGINTPIAFVITNVGNVPAVRVWAYVKLLAWSGSLADEQEKTCDEPSRQMQTKFGYTIFPNEQFPNSFGISKWTVPVLLTKEEIARGLRADYKTLLLFIVGCIDYTFPTDPTAHHQTPFIRRLFKKDLPFLSVDDGKIAADKLLLMEEVIGIGRSAN